VAKAQSTHLTTTVQSHDQQDEHIEADGPTPSRGHAMIAAVYQPLANMQIREMVGTLLNDTAVTLLPTLQREMATGIVTSTV
jgi:hypothetical protein